MRITSGEYKNRVLSTQIPSTTRPTTEALRQSIFSALASISMVEHSIFLDLFAGTGSMGLEAISRGAAKSVFVDNQKEALQCIKENVSSLQIPKSKVQAFYGDAISVISSGVLSDSFSYIYIDPPYKSFYTDQLFDLFEDKNLLKFDSIVITELQTGMKVPTKIFDKFVCVNTLETPQASVQFWKLL